MHLDISAAINASSNFIMEVNVFDSLMHACQQRLQDKELN